MISAPPAAQLHVTLRNASYNRSAVVRITRLGMSASKDGVHKSDCAGDEVAEKEGQKLIQSTPDDTPDRVRQQRTNRAKEEASKKEQSKSTIIRTVVSAVPVVEHCDKPMSKYEIVTVREHHGFFRKAIPLMPVSLSIFLCILNVITPGIGTLFSSVAVLCGCKTEYANKGKSFCYTILAALLQLITSPVVVGWVWSIMWGVTFVNISTSKDLQACINAAQV